MSHVDEGTLHAYLDGELPPVERERVDTHLKGCPACQSRLIEERSLIERASKLLGMATPPERTMPPLQELRQPRLAWRLRRPLAWAATVLLAIGLGWTGRGLLQMRAESTGPADKIEAFAISPEHQPSPVVDTPAATVPPVTHLATRGEPRLMDSRSKDREAEGSLAARPAGPANGAVAALESSSVTTGALAQNKVDASPRLPRAATAVSVRGSQAPAAPAADQAAAGNVIIDGSVARQRTPVIMSTQWPIIARQPARDVLGVEPVVIPGFAVRAYRRNPAAREIVVEQVTDAGTAISLIERRVDFVDYGRADTAATNEPRAMAKSMNERLARFVGLLRVEIDGPLTPDSLSSLLELAR